MRTLLLWIAGGLFLAGVVVGFLPVKSGEYSCGSAFHKSSDVDTKQLTGTLSGGLDYGPQDCAHERTAALRLPIVLLIMGAATVGGAVSLNPPTVESSARRTGIDAPPAG